MGETAWVPWASFKLPCCGTNCNFAPAKTSPNVRSHGLPSFPPLDTNSNCSSLNDESPADSFLTSTVETCKRWRRRTESPDTRSPCPGLDVPANPSPSDRIEEPRFFIDTGIYSFVYHSKMAAYEPPSADDTDRENRRRRKSSGTSAHQSDEVSDTSCSMSAELNPGKHHSVIHCELPVSCELGQESLNLQQFWFSKCTLDTLAAECRSIVWDLKRTRPSLEPRIALLSVPSLYFSLDSHTRTFATIFEYDRRWQQNSNFVFFDFNHPENIDEDLHNQFDIIIADPPFIRVDVLEKYYKAIELVKRVVPDKKISDSESDIDSATSALASLSIGMNGTSSKINNIVDSNDAGTTVKVQHQNRSSCSIILSTSSLLAPIVYELLSLNECKFKPYLPSLALSRMKQYSFFINYPSTRLSQPNTGDFRNDCSRKNRLKIELLGVNRSERDLAPISDIFRNLSLSESNEKLHLNSRIDSTTHESCTLSKYEELTTHLSDDEIDWDNEYASNLGQVPHDL